MADSRSTLDDEVDDEPLEDSRETCGFWYSREGECRIGPLSLDVGGPCADCPRAAEGPAPLLTDAERDAVRMAGELYTHIAEHVTGDGPAWDADLAELAAAVHVIQRAVMAQAAARAYPGEFRLLGRACGD